MDLHVARTTTALPTNVARPHRMALISLAALSALAMAGCAKGSVTLAGPQGPVAGLPSTSTPTPSTVSWSSLCQSIGDISALTVTRTDLPENHLSFGVPTPIAATDPAQARSIARSICSLTTVPAGTSYYCPLDWNVRYTLEFTLPGSAGQSVNADPSGCAWATLAGAPHEPVRRTTTAFWSGLGTAVGLPDATERSFAGTPPQ